MNNDIYKNQSHSEQIMNEGGKYTVLEKIVYDKGVFLHFKGAEYPMKVLTSPDILSHVNIIKALFIEIIKLKLTPTGILTAFNRIGVKVLSPYFLKDEYRTLQTKELANTLYNFAFSLTSNESIASDFSQILSHLIEYDNAYRLRFIDIASEVDKSSLYDNPKQEIKRLLSIYIPREVQHKGMVTGKVSRAVSILLWILKIPSVYKAFRYAISYTNFDNMKYDDIDRYWAFLREDYDFVGLSKVVRSKILSDNGYSIPELK